MLRATYRHYAKFFNSHVGHCCVVTLTLALSKKNHGVTGAPTLEVDENRPTGGRFPVGLGVRLL